MGERIQNSVGVTFTRLILDWLRPRISGWYISAPISPGTRTIFDPFDWENKPWGTLPKVGYGVIVDEDYKFVTFSHPPSNAQDDSILMNDIRRLYASSPTFFEEMELSIAIIDKRIRGECTCGYTIPGKRYRTG